MLISAEFESLLVSAVCVVLLAATIAIYFLGRGSPHADRLAAAALAAVVGLATLAILVRWSREQQGPFLTLYDILLSNLFSLGLVYATAFIAVPAIRSTAGIVLPFLSLLSVWLLTTDAVAVPLPATFDNPWLWLHVISGKLFFALAMIAAASAAGILVTRLERPQAQSSESNDTPVWQLASIAFVLHSFMLIAGAVWAHTAWGRYWAWDPLETWTLITWLLLGLVLHGRVTFRRMPDSVWQAGLIAVFVIAFLTFLGVPFVSPAPHKGVM